VTWVLDSRSLAWSALKISFSAFNIEFACAADASVAANRLSQQLKSHNLTKISSRQLTKKSDDATTFTTNSSSILIFIVQA
jgi:hypothetical protein